MTAGVRRVQVQISGRVQGVFFRARTRDKARSLGLKGWVRNLRNGDVELVAEGHSVAVAALLDWCRVGPLLARVETCRVSEQPPTGEFADFGVEPDF